MGGDTRFDTVIEIAEKFEPVPAIEAFIRDKNNNCGRKYMEKGRGDAANCI